MSLVLLPCEVFHREFDSKLLLSLRLASEYKISSLVGYDKYFSHLSHNLSHALLMDKSCSSNMWKQRIKPIKERNGVAVVSDEEGFNNVNSAKKNFWLNRVDREAVNSIDNYFCWGSVDKEFYSVIPQLKPKMKIMGNCRSDLLGDIGKEYFKEEASGLKSLFGDFILCSDNFCIEWKIGDYKPPKSDNSEEENLASTREYLSGMEEQKVKREYFANMIEKAAKQFDDKMFIIRPHPMAKPNWWEERFKEYKNVRVIYLMSIEPWLHSANCLISMGCTTGLQAVISNTPLIELVDGENGDLKSQQHKGFGGFGHLFAAYNASCYTELSEAIEDIAKKRIYNNRTNLLNDYWHKCIERNATSRFAKIINNLLQSKQQIPLNYYSETLNVYHKYARKKNLSPHYIKWPETVNKAKVSKKISKYMQLLKLDSIRMSEVASGLYLITNANS